MTRVAKEAKEHVRQQNREWNAHTWCFLGVPTGKPKEDLRDIAWALGLLGLRFNYRSNYAKKQTINELKTDMQAFLDSHCDALDSDEQYVGLFNKKPARPINSVAPKEPPQQQL